MKKVYIVQGETGEYSDRYEWLVRAFLKKESAENYKNKNAPRGYPEAFLNLISKINYL